MQKIGSSTSTADANGEFTEGSGAGGIKATQLKAAWLNSIQRELIGLLTEAGLVPKADDDTQLRAAVKAIAKAISNAYGIGGAAVDGAKVNLNDAGLGTILRFEGSQADALALNYPAVSSTGTVQVNFETLTYGMTGRIVQETTEIFGAGGQGRGRTLFRVKHDTTWYPWREVAMLDSPVPTKSAGDNSQSMANTAFVKGQRGSVLAKAVDGSADVTLSADEAGNPILWLSGALTGNISVILPAAQSRWVVYNRTTGAYTLTLKTPSSTQNVVIAQGAQAEIICGGSNLYRTHSELPDVIGSVQATGEIRSTGANAFRSVSASYGAFWRNDGNALYLLLTANGDPYGTWNSLRPFAVNLATGKIDMSNGLTTATLPRGDNSFNAANTAHVLDSVGIRTGAVDLFAASAAPTGYLKANGAAISRTTYAALFTVIGTTFGAGDGSTTFNLPDLRGEFLRVWDDGRGADSGRTFGSSQASQNLSHNHTATAANAGAHNHTFTLRNDRASGDGNAVYGDEAFYSGDATLGTSTAGDHTHAITIAASGGTEARPRNVALLACIKY